MNRRDFLTFSAGTAGLATLASPRTHAADDHKKRNVVLFIADDHGMDDARCLGNPVVHTPGIDLLASEGVRLPHAYCTTASCSPSRSVLLTGMHNHANGQYGLAHAEHHFVSLPNVHSLPVMLSEAGYRTVNAGKFHTEPESLYHFEERLGGGDPAKMADTCKPVLEMSDGRPFFLCFCPTEPHRPFLREGSDPISPKDVVVPPWLPDIPECREDLAEYLMSAQRCDSGLVRLIQLLKETGRWDDTLVIYLSDNGAPFPGAKTTQYEPGTRLPCIVRNPFDKRRNNVCNACVTWADITPTILDFLDVKPKRAAFHGKSFLNAIKEDDPSDWDETYGSHTFHEVTMYYPMRTVRTRRHKLIWNIASGLEFPFASDLWKSKTWQAVLKNGVKEYGARSVDAYLHRPLFELYDLQEDPWETHNLADNPQQAVLLAELKEKLRQFQKNTGDPWILKWTRE